MSNAVVRASVERASWFPRDGSSAEDEVGGGTGVGRDGLQQLTTQSRSITSNPWRMIRS